MHLESAVHSLAHHLRMCLVHNSNQLSWRHHNWRQGKLLCNSYHAHKGNKVTDNRMSIQTSVSTRGPSAFALIDLLSNSEVITSKVATKITNKRLAILQPTIAAQPLMTLYFFSDVNVVSATAMNINDVNVVTAISCECNQSPHLTEGIPQGSLLLRWWMLHGFLELVRKYRRMTRRMDAKNSGDRKFRLFFSSAVSCLRTRTGWKCKKNSIL